MFLIYFAIFFKILFFSIFFIPYFTAADYTDEFWLVIRYFILPITQYIYALLTE